MRKAQEPWKRKENRLTDRAARGEARGLIERSQMEDEAKASYTLRVWGDLGSLFASHMKTGQHISVYLKRPIPIQEIERRVNQAFGDI